ncbi:MAG: hypothetical protein ACK4OF_03950 [Aquificaceae bacterium]
MKRILALSALVGLALASFLLSLLYFSNPQYRKEKIEGYKQTIDKRLHRPQ